MKFEEKLKTYKAEELWQEYCGFLDLSLDDFMVIQNRLMLEQMELWCNSSLGQKILKGKHPSTVEEFRLMVPLTTYEDYADILLLKEKEMLPEEPVLWLQTTWEGGTHPVKVAPYTKGMFDTYKHNMVGCLMLSTSMKRGQFRVKPKDTILYGLAPLPYATGVFPVLLNEEIEIEFLPSVKEAQKLSFGERNKKGFKLGLQKGIDFFFGVGSVTYYVSLSLASLSKGSKKKKKQEKQDENKESITAKIGMLVGSICMLVRIIRGSIRAKKEQRELQPKDLFKLKGFMCAGTDNRCYKDELEELWGIRPMEIFAGTEPTCIGTEIWSRDGLYFFPDACFYEFIPENGMSQTNPKTYLLNEVITGEKYELVITVFKGGAFARYRVGDVYRCIGLENRADGTTLPRFEYIDRVPSVIDIAGFTRITEKSIEHVMELSGLKIEAWVAAKEYNEHNKPYLHLYVEMNPQALTSQAITIEVLREQLGIYFKYVDGDFKDLKKILGMDPLVITILRCGTFANYKHKYGKNISLVNPSSHCLKDLLECQVKELHRDMEG
ncbi:GH3 family domain-containing protein [Lachnospiraceae bacterium LCP25S3_G4]